MGVDCRVRQRLHKIALPIPLQALRKERIEKALHGRERHSTHPVEDRWWKPVEQRRHDLCALFGRPVIGGYHGTGTAAPVVAREWIHRWDGLETDERTKLLRRSREEIAICSHDCTGMFRFPKDRPGIDRAHRMSLEQETGDHAKIAAATAQC